MRILPTAFMIIATLYSASAQETGEHRPTIQDLEFLIGTWEVTFDFYDPRKPDEGLALQEKGINVCEYSMPFNGEPKYIVCTGTMTSRLWDERVFKEYTEYNPFIKNFQRMAIYSNWPGMAIDTVIYDPDMRTLDVRGELQVQDNGIERYQDYYHFNEDYTAYQRTAVSNFSDMPVSEYNLVFNSSARKIE